MTARQSYKLLFAGNVVFWLAFAILVPRPYMFLVGFALFFAGWFLGHYYGGEAMKEKIAKEKWENQQQDH